MKLENENGMFLISKTEYDIVRGTALEIRKSIIVHGKTHDVNVLNKCCRMCNKFIKLVDEMF